MKNLWGVFLVVVFSALVSIVAYYFGGAQSLITKVVVLGSIILFIYFLVTRGFFKK